MVNDRISRLEKRLEGETKAEKSLDLLDLLENAVFLGAERIRVVLEELITKVGKAEEDMRDSEYRLLLRELIILQDVLSSLVPEEITRVKKEDLKNDSKKQADKDKLDADLKVD